MDHGQFDALTRSVASGRRTRRAAFRLLAGGALGGVVTRLGLMEFTEAKKSKKWRGKEKHGTLQDEGKRKRKKDRNKKHDKKRHDKHDESESPQPCSLFCTDVGGRCCPGGICAYDGDCCSGEKRCDDRSCIAPDQCCPGERTCAGGLCLPLHQCCPEQRECPTACVPKDECCPGEKPCTDGTCIAEDQCCSDTLPPLCSNPSEAPLCCHGREVCRPYLTAPGCPAWPERAYDPASCRCLCPNNTNDSLGRCCPLDYPTGSLGQDGYCCRWEDCGGYECSRCVCALGYSEVNGVCRRT